MHTKISRRKQIQGLERKNRFHSVCVCFFYTLPSIICLFINEIVGELITTAIRPTVFYGEEDPYFFPTLAKVTKKTGGIIPKLLGAGGKHQMTYVGKSTVQCFDYIFSCFLRFLSHSLSFHLTIIFIELFFSLCRQICRKRCLGTHSSKTNAKKFTEKYRWFAGFRD